MRRIIAMMTLALLIPPTMWADEIEVAEFKVGRFNSVFKKQMDEEFMVRYDIEKKNIFLVFKDVLWVVAVKITDEERMNLLTYIQKYKAWNKKATAEGDKLQKNIGELGIQGIWKTGDDWQVSGDSIMAAVFFSQSTTTHQLVLSFQKWQSLGNEFITVEPSEIYFSYKDVLALEGAISDSGLQKAIKKRVKEKSVESKYD
jgi:hypothetical protein